jgi:hypothetical protein
MKVIYDITYRNGFEDLVEGRERGIAKWEVGE